MGLNVDNYRHRENLNLFLKKNIILRANERRFILPINFKKFTALKLFGRQVKISLTMLQVLFSNTNLNTHYLSRPRAFELDRHNS